jgi:hypothetical protein
MDQTGSNIIAIVGLSVSVLTAVVGALNHKRIRSTCCGNKAEASLDIENTSPKPPTLN